MNKKIPKLEKYMWNKIADFNLAKGYIYTPYFETGKFEGDNIPIDMFKLPENAKIIDFGSGLGRNTKVLIEMKENSERIDVEIYGYDYINMIEMAKNYLENDWNKVHWIEYGIENLQALEEIDVIISYIVFQHMKEKELRSVLNVLSNILRKTGILIVHSRGYSDDENKNIWKMLSDYFVAITNVNENDGTENHQTVIYRPKK